MIGTSLSFCIREMVEGKVDPSQVSKIISNTRCATQEDWRTAFDRYRQVIWEKNPHACESLARQWIADGKVEQPRLSDRHHCSNPAWVDDETEIKWFED